jgi:hypothetical protein
VPLTISPPQSRAMMSIRKPSWDGSRTVESG